eukprot:scaffold72965_cov21-Tisochrysis_lutea.AAC.1
MVRSRRIWNSPCASSAHSARMTSVSGSPMATISSSSFLKVCASGTLWPTISQPIADLLFTGLQWQWTRCSSVRLLLNHDLMWQPLAHKKEVQTI